MMSQNAVRDVGIIVDDSLKFDKHISFIVHKAMSCCKLILKSFQSKDKTLLVKAFNTYVRPILEYCSPVWSPHYYYLIEKLEHVQRYFTKRIPGLWRMSYNEPLNNLGIHSLKCRRNMKDLTMCFQIISKNVSTSISNCFEQPANNQTLSQTRGNSRKLFKHFAINNHLKFFFSNRIISQWNKLPDQIVTSPSTMSFKNNLSKHHSICTYC